MRTGALQHDRAVEACHQYARQASCTDRPIPFADYLHQSNREHRDTLEISPACQRLGEAQNDTSVRTDEPVRAVSRPEVPRTETVRRVEFTYEIRSDLPTGQLIDVLL